ncbi:DUF2460 domain-containing protein [Sphingomonas sp. BN140010]|uniref:DUF2460 domain-containing protein n=1 Tax=Sphingomonas arvum TaxID=2992113 RepID=A0ABT3JIL1_9SPHN|nr:DUF2460 domain-containing protein [Sphingomonas sp. BN140010]MCW3798626.1 DUF2460 domain-containing protein [Sphingomonas sp. BN140010]
MIRHWVTREDAPLERSFIKRFDPQHFTVDFPRGARASIVLGGEPHSLLLTAEFLRPSDLVGLIYESEDRYAHPVHKRETKRDYSHCQLRFRWQSEGLVRLDAVNGPTLTIEGRDSGGAPRTWYVRLWNYASGQPEDAEIKIDFDDLREGFALSREAGRVYPGDIDRMFFSLVAPGYDPSSSAPFERVRSAALRLTNMACDGSGSVLDIADAMVPEHAVRMCTAYDDLYQSVPERVVDLVERLGYRKVINHYVGMSHYQRLLPSGLLDSSVAVNSAAERWHEAFATAAKERGFEVIFSLSFELLDMFCPEAWKQRDWSGRPALTGYAPPSTLVSPASGDAVDYLRRVALRFCRLLTEAELPVRFQIGEPWWWISSDYRLCAYDPATRAAIGGDVIDVGDVRGAKSSQQKAMLDRAGQLLAAATASIAGAVRAEHAGAQLALLTYLCGTLDPQAPELRRANLPLGWSSPAFDVLQIEDYEWVTRGRKALASAAGELAATRLNYALGMRHYLAGFASQESKADDWEAILGAIRSALRKGLAEVFVWALPQIVRDAITIFDDGSERLNAFDDVAFPIEIGAEASIAPAFSTTVVTSASGHEFRNSNWAQARLRFDAGPGVRGERELGRLVDFFRARRGSAVGFRFRDPYDFSSASMSDEPAASDQLLGVGDGRRTEFPLLKRYGTGEQRRITRPLPGSVRIAVGSDERHSGWSMGEHGFILFDMPPEAGEEVRAGFLFDVPVRFASDQLEINRASFQAGEAPSVPLIEIREDC